MSDVLSFFDTVDLIKRFLEIAFHLILYYRQVYPPGIFERTKRWNIEIWTCRHPALSEYIGKAVASIAEELKKRTLASVSLIIKTADLKATPLERFTFNTEWFLARDSLPAEPLDFLPKEQGMSKSDAEHYLRAFLIKLSAADAYLTPLPEHTTFAIVLQLDQGAPAPPETVPSARNARVPWIPADESDVPDRSRDASRQSERAGAGGAYSTVPIKSTRFGMLNLGLDVVEWDVKASAREKELASSGEAQTSSVDQMPPQEQQHQRKDKGKGRALDW